MLAIIIPYYKKTFFRETMESIASQACKDFVLYIGDDASHENPQDIIEDYKDKINIVYHRFDENLGGKDLVAQWERCINLTKGEDWLWVFSDDDTMDSTCVADFYSVIKDGDSGDLLRFRKETVSADVHKSYMTTYQAGKCPFADFLPDCLLLTNDNPTMPEFIFSRAIYDKLGFINFPLAWGSDRITYLKYAMETGCVCNLESIVHFKMCGQNISSDINGKIMGIKSNARIMTIETIRDILTKIPDKYPEINLTVLKDMFVDRFSFLCKASSLSGRLKTFRYMWTMATSIKSKKTLLKFVIGF